MRAKIFNATELYEVGHCTVPGTRSMTHRLVLFLKYDYCYHGDDASRRPTHGLSAIPHERM